MILPSITFLVSFILDSFISNYIPSSINNMFLLTPFFTVVSLVVVYPYFNHEDKNFFIWCFALGLLYDIAYTDTLLLNATIFVILGFLIKLVNTTFSNSILNVGVISYIILILYHTLTFLILLIIGQDGLTGSYLINLILKSFFLNFTYATGLYFILNRVSEKYKIKRII